MSGRCYTGIVCVCAVCGGALALCGGPACTLFLWPCLFLRPTVDGRKQ